MPDRAERRVRADDPDFPQSGDRSEPGGGHHLLNDGRAGQVVPGTATWSRFH
jgi:hypothetical protein